MSVSTCFVLVSMLMLFRSLFSIGFCSTIQILPVCVRSFQFYERVRVCACMFSAAFAMRASIYLPMFINSNWNSRTSAKRKWSSTEKNISLFGAHTKCNQNEMDMHGQKRRTRDRKRVRERSENGRWQTAKQRSNVRNPM